MGIKQQILSCIPDAYYSDGTKATCMTFRIYNMFDVANSDSFKEVKEKKDMGESTKTNTTKDQINYPPHVFGEYSFIERFLADRQA